MMHPMTVEALAHGALQPFRCECCDRELNTHTMTWLERHSRTGEWAEPGSTTWSDGPESQGHFPFGKACAKRALEASGHR